MAVVLTYRSHSSVLIDHCQRIVLIDHCHCIVLIDHRHHIMLIDHRHRDCAYGFNKGDSRHLGSLTRNALMS